jgi:uncharacterized protein YqgV (UPF0045/DUF77 family)
VSAITAQVSLYPLREPHLGPAIDIALQILRRRPLGIEPGTMSTVVTGPSEELFPALQAVFEEIARRGDLVMVVTCSNACPERNRLRRRRTALAGAHQLEASR